MLLQPRKFTYKNKFKDRRFRYASINKLNYGSFGVRLAGHIWLTAKKASRLTLFLKRAARKVDISNRFVWFNASPHFPASKKIKGARMGKGTGKLTCWFTFIRAGSTVIEFKNSYCGQALYYMRQFSNKMAVPTTLLWSSWFFVSVGRKRSVQKKVDPVYFQ